MSKAAQLLAELEGRSLHLAVAESLTGGGLSGELTAPAGASKIVLGAIVAYQTELKNELLGVSKSLLAESGAVDARVAAQMASGVRTLLAQKCAIAETSVIGVATSGVAGPTEQDGKPVGTVFIAIAGDGFENQVLALELTGNREAIRSQTVDLAIDFLWEQFRP